MEKEIQGNAIKVLKDLMQVRKWHQEKYTPTKASGYKDLLNKGKLSYEKSIEILHLLGYKKVKEETWEKV